MKQRNRLSSQLKDFRKTKNTALHHRNIKQQRQKDTDPYPERVPHSESALDRYDWGDRLSLGQIQPGPDRHRLACREETVTDAVDQMVTNELLLQHQPGLLQADRGEDTADIAQSEICSAVDITSATRRFDLSLRQYAPYSLRYSRNGRYLALGGRCGHLAAFDAVTKKLMCEVGVTESIHDVQWLHNENMFAAAQKEWVYVYDSGGIELHCMKKLNRVLAMEFLPYHFLLATCSERGWLSWLDVSTGGLVRQVNARMGRLSTLCQNPANALICLPHCRGVVSMWAPSVEEPVARLLCHDQPVRSVSVERSGTYMATACVDRSVKIWDLRNYGCVQNFSLSGGASNVRWSQTKLLSASVGNMVEVYKDVHVSAPDRCYLRHRCSGAVSDVRFCPFEDVLGIGHRDGFSSILVPGAGEPNFDAYESNPFETRKQRREAEVKQLLDKINPELISLNPNVLGEVDVPTLQETFAAKQKLLHVKTPKIDFTPRKKTKGRSRSLKTIQRKKGVKEQEKKAYIREVKRSTKHYVEATQKSSKDTSKPAKTPAVLDRFKPKAP